jgi:mannose-6-phosphate isomerase-like protein (cupin superfamily)
MGSSSHRFSEHGNLIVTHTPFAAARTFDLFQAKALTAGFDEALVREWPPGETLELHAHPFDSQALVTQGEMWLTQGDETRHLVPGDTFTLASGEPHAKRYGPKGAIYWVARRNTG